MGPDFVYPNAPLVEIIAELRWLPTPNPAIGPHPLLGGPTDFVTHFAEKLKSQGYVIEERLMPPMVPAQLLSHIPFLRHVAMVRLRKNPNEWPVFQCGPGLVTVNQVPPYDGWANFRPCIDLAYATMMTSHVAVGSEAGNLSLTLRYIDAFRASHGMNSPAAFIRDHLGFAAPLPAVFLDLVEGDSERALQTGAVVLNLSGEHQETARLEVNVGTVEGKPAVVTDWSITAPHFSVAPNQENVAGWFDKAHMAIRRMFNDSVSNDLKKTFGEPQPSSV